MRNYKYVKFSKSTAKQNPQMIANAYKKLIKNKEDLLKSFNNRSFKINVGLYSLTINELIYLRHKNYLTWDTVELTVNSEQIIEFYDKIQNKYKKELELREELKQIHKEFSKFRARFI